MPTIKEFVSLMNEYSSSAFNSWDGAENYGVSEDIMGLHKDIGDRNGQYVTKYVPEMGAEVSFEITEKAINTSLRRMKTDSNPFDLLQFHLWDYSNPDGCIQVLGYLKTLAITM